MDIALYIIILIVAIWLISIKPSGNSKIDIKEAEAKDRLDRFFNKLSEEEISYKLLLNVNELFYAGAWKPISREDFERKVIGDCVRPTGVSRFISDARFSVSISTKNKSIYCVVGANNINFNKIHNKQRQSDAQ